MPEIINNDIIRRLAEIIALLQKKSIGIVILTSYIDKTRRYFDKNLDIIIYNRLNNDFLCKKKIKQICKQYDIDAINLCELGYILTAYNVVKQLKIPLLCTIFNIKKPENDYDKTILSTIYKSSFIIAMSKYVCDFLLNYNIFDLSKIIYINEFANPENFDFQSITKGRIVDVVAEIDTNICDKKIILCPCDYKNIDMCLELIKIISKIDAKNFVFIFIGTFKDTKKNRLTMLKEIKKYNLYSKVKIIDSILDIYALYSSIYFLLLLQKDDNIYTSNVCEANFMKKPSIISRTNYSTYNIVDNKTGILVQKYNVSNIVSAINYMLNLPENDYNIMCEEAYKYANDFFNAKEKVDKIEDKWNELYKLLAKGKK